MNSMNFLKVVSVVVVALASANVWSQTSEKSTSTNPTASSSVSAPTSKSAARKANRALSRKVLQALQKGGVTTSGINVIAKGGAVVLAGRVVDASQIDRATSLAKNVVGVTSVKNALTVQEAGQ
jgi:hyperosmotically inducible periplasmic protein